MEKKKRKNWKEKLTAVYPFIYLGAILLLFMYIPFWYVLLILFIFYTAIALWQLYTNPGIFFIFEGYFDKWEVKHNDKWYAKTIRFISRPIYWFVDKSKERWDREED